MPRHTQQPSGTDASPAREGISLSDLVAVTAAVQEKRPRAGRKGALQARGAVVGQLAGFSEAGRPLVTFAGGVSRRPIEARTVVELREAHAGSEVVLIFERDDARKPIILGVLREPGRRPAERAIEAALDGETVLLTADKEIVLRCGRSSITLTRAGKVLIRGEYLLSRSAGVNRIKGGSVQIN